MGICFFSLSFLSLFSSFFLDFLFFFRSVDRGLPVVMIHLCRGESPATGVFSKRRIITRF